MQSGPARPRVVLAANSLLLGDGLAALLRERDIEVVGRAQDLDQVATLVETEEPDVLVVTVLTPVVSTMATIALARDLHARRRSLGIVVVSDRGDGFAIELLRGGSDRIAYLVDEHLPSIEVVIDALRQVMAGQTVLSPSIVASLLDRNTRPQIDDLTVRELDVLENLAYGASNGAIAARLNLSVKAVEKHVTVIFRKLGLTGQDSLDRRVTAAVIYLRSRAAPFD
ncbi:LuxR C-terminal-related transcriptional regulator [Longivirga aurantiaca]|uniref:LuxR C-terminal-related transcriptional regulator n=1 Tax=Longivirga aurantiaca TaxID=1837743 RepID=A0ABW1SWH0_9ACTN